MLAENDSTTRSDNPSGGDPPGTTPARPDSLYCVRWKSLYSDATGEIGPMPEDLARQMAEEHNGRFPDILHWAAQVEDFTEEPEEKAYAADA